MTRRTVTVEIGEKLSLVVSYAIVKAEPDVNVHAGWDDEELLEVVVGGMPNDRLSGARRPAARFTPHRNIGSRPDEFFDALFAAHADEIRAAIEADITDMDPPMERADVEG